MIKALWAFKRYSEWEGFKRHRKHLRVPWPRRFGHEFAHRVQHPWYWSQHMARERNFSIPSSIAFASKIPGFDAASLAPARRPRRRQSGSYSELHQLLPRLARNALCSVQQPLTAHARRKRKRLSREATPGEGSSPTRSQRIAAAGSTVER